MHCLLNRTVYLIFFSFSCFVTQAAPVEFSVKWKNYPETANTWEPLENLGGCMRLVCKFLMHMGSQMVPEAHMIAGAHSASSSPVTLVWGCSLQNSLLPL